MADRALVAVRGGQRGVEIGWIVIVVVDAEIGCAAVGKRKGAQPQPNPACVLHAFSQIGKQPLADRPLVVSGYRLAHGQWIETPGTADGRLVIQRREEVAAPSPAQGDQVDGRLSRQRVAPVEATESKITNRPPAGVTA